MLSFFATLMSSIAKRNAASLVFLGLLLVGSSSSLAAQSLPSSDSPLRIAIGTVPEPLLIRSDEAPPRGLIPEFWRVWSRFAERDIEIVVFDTNGEARGAVRRGDADFLASLPITHLPEEGLALTLPYARLTQGLVTEQQDLRVEEIEGQILRYQAEVTETEAAALLTGLEVRSLEATSGRFAEMFEVSSAPVLTPSMRMSLSRMQREGVSDDLYVVPFSSRFIFAATATGRSDLVELFNRYLAMIPDSVLEGIGGPEGNFGLPPFFLPSRDRFELSPEEVEWLQGHPVVRLGASPWEPLTIVDEAGRYTGIAIETLRETLARLGVYLIVVGNDDWETIVKQASTGAIDGLGFTAPRPEANFLYTDPILDAPVVAVNRANDPFFGSLDELPDGRIVIPVDYGLLARLRQLHSPRLQFLVSSSSQASARMVSRGDADVMIDFLPNAQRAIRSQGITNLKSAARLDETTPTLATALRPDWPALVGLMNRAAATRSRDEQIRLFERFMTPEPQFHRTGLYVLIGALLLTILALSAAAAVRRRRTGLLLRASEELLRRAERVSNSGSWKLDRRTGEVVFSAESHRLFGWPSETRELPFEDYCKLYQPAAQEMLRAAIGSADSSDAPFVLALSEGERSHRCSVEAVGEWQVIGTLTDVTREERERRERQRLEAQIHQTERLDALGRLAGGIAHDFNNILAVGLANAELAKLDLSEEHPALQSVEEFIKASIRGKELVQQIQVFGRRKNPERRRIDLSDNVRAVVGLLRASLPPSIEVSADLLDSPLWVNASTTEIDRALMNLGINAGQAMPNGGQLRFVVRRERVEQLRTASTGILEPGDYSVVEVTDSGVGIDAEHMPHIFEPYFTHRVDGDGTGLGLSIVHGTIVDHGGHLEVVSDPARRERGTTTVFTIHLPEALAEPVAQGDLIREEKAVFEPAGSGEQVLLIDDEEALVESNRKLFEKLGFEVSAHTHPRAALREFRDAPQSFALVVTDLLMPDLSGVDVARAIKEARADCPVVLTTGYAAEHDLSNAPVDAIVDKPVPADQWARVFRETLPKAVKAAV